VTRERSLDPSCEGSLVPMLSLTYYYIFCSGGGRCLIGTGCGMGFSGLWYDFYGYGIESSLHDFTGGRGWNTSHSVKYP
jgi:hypothetical protein